MTENFTALFFGPFRVVTNVKENTYSLENSPASIGELVKKIVMDYPSLSEFIFQGDVELSENTNIIINGETGSDLKFEIKPTDRIAFFKAAGGG